MISTFSTFNKIEMKHKLNGKTLVLTFHGFLQSFKSRDNVRTQWNALFHPSTHLPCVWGKDTGSRVRKLQQQQKKPPRDQGSSRPPEM